MTKIHPKFSNTYEESLCDSKAAVVLTVWKKSLLFNCDGFTVYNSNGNLVFRVDNYMNSPRDNIVLMDASGLPLLSIRRKKLSLGDCWAVYDGETQRDPIFTAKKNVSILTNKRNLAWVCAKKTVLYEVEGSYGQKSCKIVDVRRNNKKTAEIKKKDAMVGGGSFGKDVFKLIVESDMEPRVAMALTIILDQMFRSY
ncbi:Protein LURP-one-related 8 [Hirschfeldia incana]|nr:Protein LURP-one-related 8 [Hirschfeldia incana]